LNRGSVILTAVVIYLGVCIGVGLWAMRRTKSSNDFFMGGRNLGPLVIGFAAFSSTLSGFGFVGGPGLVYRMGMSSIWMVVVSAISIAIGFSVVAKRARLLAQLGDCISLPDVAYLRFRSNLVRGLLAMSVVLQEVLRDANFFPDISLGMAVTVSTSVLLFYTVTGGIIASVYTDLIQGIIMVVAAVLVFGTILTTFDGGMAEISSIIAADDAQAMGPWGTIGV
jgi:Na+/proline symporter